MHTAGSGRVGRGGSGVGRFGFPQNMWWGPYHDTAVVPALERDAGERAGCGDAGDVGARRGEAELWGGT